jgi:hypothetical protein
LFSWQNFSKNFTTFSTFGLFAWLISHQPAVLFSHNKPVITNQPAVLLSELTSTSHKPPANRTGCFSPSHHIKYTKRHMFGTVNVGKKITNYTVLMYFATRIF